MKIRKAILPVAGLGTRFLPITKAIPKEMLPVVNKPLIQYAVEEALDSGIEQIVFVTGKGKNALEDYFDYSHMLQQILKQRNKKNLVLEMEKIVPKEGTIIYTRQIEPLGLGHAVWCAKDIIGNEPFAVILADDLIKSDTPVLRQMLNAYEKIKSSIIAIMKINKKDASKYGIIDADPIRDNVTEIRNVVEKPTAEKAPSDMAVIGRYILTPDLFDILDRKKMGVDGEIQLTDALKIMIQKKKRIYGFDFKGTRFDCGNKIGFQMANISFAMDIDEMKEPLVDFMKKIISSRN